MDRIAPVHEEDLPDLLPLMRAYCDFYGSAPEDGALRELMQSLLANPEEGLQLIARADGDGAALGFATIYWTWSSTRARRVGVMNDLYVSSEARGSGLAEALIEACADRCAERGVDALEWMTAPDNLRAQAVYDRVGGVRSEWIEYTLDVTAARSRRSPGRTG